MKKMKQILFSTPMVQAILDGRKTQTRRVCKALENYDFIWGLDRKPYIGDYKTFAKVAPRKWGNVTLENVWLYDLQTAVDESKTYVLKPSYQPGDILWVRETWAKVNIGKFDGYIYRADNDPDEADWKWRPSIYMPREAARIFLRVTNVRVERLQEITENDAKNEGVKDPYDYQESDYYEQKHMRGLEINKSAFAGLWDSLNAKRGYGWETNPWVWVYEFERVEGMKC